MDIDLTLYFPSEINALVLIVSDFGNASASQAIWVAPRIIRYLAGPVITPTSPVITTNTPIVPTSVPSSTPSSASSCDRAQFISDVSVPDGTTFAPNFSFAKTWRLQNVGTCTWTTAYSLVFVSGDRMSAPSPVFLPQTVVPNQTVDVGVNLVSPSTAANIVAIGNWQTHRARYLESAQTRTVRSMLISLFPGRPLLQPLTILLPTSVWLNG